MEFGIGPPESKLESGVSDSGRSGESRLRISTDNNGGGVDKKLKSENVDVKVENSGGDRFDDYLEDLFETKDVSDFQHDRLDAGSDRKESVVDLLSEFDDFVANDKSGAIGMAATSRAHSYGFEIGDMVWGKVKSHPWWPGHIFNEAFASSSVRRTRREGHVLVAFFGDSSYGWFDPAELIPFEPNFEEKSHQLNSRTFLKAVEEAMDEVSRRRGLGLTCKCRNPYSFRPTVQGYVVDVPDFEPGTAYSWDMISKARGSFEPNETLSFVQQLALAPQGGDQGSINFLSNKATVFAYRKAVFEEFDETYAEAFGMPPGLPTRDPAAVPPPRAPLSGPLVIAETLGVEKGPVKPMKVKDPSKKDRYLFKRRDEPDNSKNLQNNQGRVNSVAPVPLMGSQVELEAVDYVLQKRTPYGAPKPQIPSKHEQTGLISGDSNAMSLDASSKEAETTHVVTEVAKVYPDKAQGAQLEMEGMSRSDGGTRSTDFSEMGDFPRVLDGGSQSMQQEKESGVITKSDGSVQKSDIEGLDRSDQVQASQSFLFDHSASVAKRSDGTGLIGGVKKLEVKKRPTGEMSSDISGAVEKKKKKRVIGPETGSEQKPKFLSPGKVKLLSAGKLPRKSNQIGLDRKEDARVEKQKKTVGSYSSLSSHSVMPVFSKANTEIELPQILSDLHSLALDPFHVIEKNSHVNVRQFILQFRSRVYQKSLAQSPPLDNDSGEVFSLAKTQVITTATNNPPSEPVRDLPSSKPTVKPISRLEDLKKSGRKRFPSDRQEEIAAKRLKKMNVIKSLAAEKKAAQKIPESQKGEEKNPAPPPALMVKPLKQDSVKKVESSKRKQDSFRKMESSAKTVNPTTLVLKFPPDTALPSLAELKARFARFGPIDQSGLRVFWKSFTCRVVFLHKGDAQAAYKYALGNTSLFGTSGVRYQLRESEAPSTEISESGRSWGEDNNNSMSNPNEIMTRKYLTPSPTVQLKSILKKSTGDEAAGGGGGGGNGKGTPRVKFMLGGEESSRNNHLNSAASSLPSSVAMDFDSNNYFHQKVLPPSQLPPLLPLPPQFNTSTSPNLHHFEIAQPLPRNTQQNRMSTASNITPTSTTTSTSNAIEEVDISQQMLSLLTRCNDVVTNLTGLLGYVPYHPL